MLWLMVTIVLGSIFVGVQCFEWSHLHHEGLWFNKGGVYGSSFFLMTGFHGAHVTIGIVMLLTLFTMSMTGRLPTERSKAVEMVGLYWHFVDIVWIVIFTLVYLIPTE